MAHKSFVFIDPSSFKKKNIEPFNQDQLRIDFEAPELIYLKNEASLIQVLKQVKKDELLLLMSSGKFASIDLEQYL